VSECLTGLFRNNRFIKSTFPSDVYRAIKADPRAVADAMTADIVSGADDTSVGELLNRPGSSTRIATGMSNHMDKQVDLHVRMRDGSLRVWEISTGVNRREITRLDACGGFDFSPDGRNIAIGWNDKIGIWNVETGDQTDLWKGHTDSVMDVNFSFDGRILVSASRDKTAMIWRLNKEYKRTIII
jgi:WD40 repeat protein